MPRPRGYKRGMAKQIEFFFDYVSPYSYLGDAELTRVAQRTGAEVVHRPMFLGGVMQATGNRPPGTVVAKGVYMSRDLERWARRYGVPMKMNPSFPQNTIGAMRGALVALEDGSFAAYHRAMFQAMWRDGVNLADDDAYRAVLAAAGLDADRFLARRGEPAIKDKLRANTDEAIARGAFGAPSFFVGEELFFGNDRLDFVAEAVTR